MTKHYLFFLIILASVVGCKNSPEEIKPAPKDQIKTSVNTVSLTNTVDHDTTFTLTSENGWSIELSDTKAAPDWFTVSPMSGLGGESVITISTKKVNQTSRDRQAYIRIISGSVGETVTINQTGIGLIDYYVSEMGTLGTMLTKEQKDTISYLKLFGKINDADFRVMRDEMPCLSVLNLSEVTVDHNKIPDNAFNRPDIILTEIILPSTITAIGNNAFENCLQLSGQLKIPDGVTSIGSRAFAGCSKLTGALNIPNTVTSIGERAFFYCTGLTSLKIPSSITAIADNVFVGCYGFTGPLELHPGITSIGLNAFAGCRGFKGSLTIPPGVTSISEGAFGDCKGLTGSLTIPSGVTSIGGTAFAGCVGFTGSLTIPPGVTSIGKSAFGGCENLSGSLNIPESVTLLDFRVFSGCKGFTGQLNIPSSVTSIGEGVFENCTGFSGLEISSGVKTIGDNAFKNCAFTGLLDLPSSLTSIGSYAFDGCNKLDKIRANWTNPISYSEKMLPEKKTLEVPVASVNLYATLYRWRDHPLEWFPKPSK